VQELVQELAQELAQEPQELAHRRGLGRLRVRLMESQHLGELLEPLP
jgi:hypothetical protein